MTRRRLQLECHPGLAIFGVGLLDDFRPVPGEFKVLVLLAAGLGVASAGFRADGPDGLVTSLTAFAGLLVWLGEPARVFMGDCGSVLLGFFGGVLSLRAALAGPAAPPSSFALLAIIGWPVLDLLRVVVQRVLCGGSPFALGAEHLHYLLASRLGERRAVLTLLGSVSAGALAALSFASGGTASAAFLAASATAVGFLMLLRINRTPLAAACAAAYVLLPTTISSSTRHSGRASATELARLAPNPVSCPVGDTLP